MAEPRFLAKAREREDSVEEVELGEPSGLIGVVGEENRGDAAAIAAADDRWAVGNGDSTNWRKRFRYPEKESCKREGNHKREELTLDLMFDMLRPFMYLAGSRRIFPFVIVGKWAEWIAGDAWGECWLRAFIASKRSPCERPKGSSAVWSFEGMLNRRTSTTTNLMLDENKQFVPSTTLLVL